MEFDQDMHGMVYKTITELKCLCTVLEGKVGLLTTTSPNLNSL